MTKVKVLDMKVKGHGQGDCHSVTKFLGQNFLHDWKYLVKYESSTSNGSKVMTKVKVFRNVGQGHRHWFYLKGGFQLSLHAK